MSKENTFKLLPMVSFIIFVLVWVPNIIFQVPSSFWLLTFIIALIGVVFAALIKKYRLIIAKTTPLPFLHIHSFLR